MIVPLPTGDSQVEITFMEGWDRLAGAMISLASLVAIGLWHKRCTSGMVLHKGLTINR
jgi:hypothetical protein